MRHDHPQQHIVVDDPEGEFWEGGLVSAEADVPVLRARGVTTLPIAPELIGLSAVGGYFRRAWGSGWPLDSAIPQMVCPMMLYVLQGGDPQKVDAGAIRRINCAVRLVRSADIEPRGSLRLTTSSGQPGVFAGGFSATNDTHLDVSKLGKPDERGGWTAYMGGTISAPANTLIGFALYGAAPGLRVAWAAISQSR
jgi:hypothetical protein